MSEADGCAWIDGEIVPIAEARIPILDTGFVRSDLTYDVAAVRDGRFFRLDDHTARLERGCRRLRLESPIPITRIKAILEELVARAGLRDAWVAMIVTRGIPPAGSRDPRTFSPRFYAYAVPYIWIVNPEQYPDGAHLVVSRRTRRIPPGSVDPTIKNFHWGDFIRGLFEAYDRGGSMAVLPDADGNVTEGPGVNLFCVRNQVMRTPARGVLQGITRATVLTLAEEAGISTAIEDVGVDELYSAEEIFLTSTGGGVMPVATLDGEPVGQGRPGAITTQMMRAYERALTDPRWAHPVVYS